MTVPRQAQVYGAAWTAPESAHIEPPEPPTNGKKTASSAPPRITPGYDYIWGSDQDELWEDPDSLTDPDDLYPNDGR